MIWEYCIEKILKFKGVPLVRTDRDRETQTLRLREMLFLLIDSNKE